MGNRVGVILHDDWNDFSPLMYSHFGANTVPFEIQDFLIDYYKRNCLTNSDGHKYNPCHMMVEFLQGISKNIHIRVENLSEQQIEKLQQNHGYPNYFDGGCWIINISVKNYGATVCGDGYYLESHNIVADILKSEYDLY